MIKTFKSSLGLLFIALGSCLFIQNQNLLFAQAKAPVIIDNPETPKYSGKYAPELVFKKELSIPLDGFLYSFDVDDTGNIYLLDILERSVSVYNSDGKNINKFGKKGQGPGEFEIPRCLVVSKRKIYVLDPPKKTILVFDTKGALLDQQRLSSTGVLYNMRFDSAESLYIQDMSSTIRLKDEKRLKRGVIGISRLSKFNGRFEKIGDIDTWDYSFNNRSPSGEVFGILYHDIFYYQIGGDNCLYFGNSSRYEIHQMTPEGRIKKIIRKKGKQIPTAAKDWTNILEDNPDLKEARDVLKMAEIKPFFAEFHVIDNVGLVVGTYEDEWNDQGFFICNLFSQDGVYIANVKVPRYHQWNQHGTYSEQRNRLFKNGRCYSLVYNEKDEALELVRHSVELKWPRP